MSTDTDIARRYAETLLRSLAVDLAPAASIPDEHPAEAWARSGLMALTGPADGEALLCPVPLPSCAEGALGALRALADRPLADLDGAALLTERAALDGLCRQGAVSPGGACRLMAVADGCLAVNLAREDDWDLLPAWLEADVAPDWEALAAALRTRPTAPLLARARLLGLAVAAVAAPEPAPWFQLVAGRAFGGRLAPPVRAPRVVDLSALWAGPLCGQLLHRLGAEVIKVESPRRPDGARNGNAAFFNRLNAGKRCVAIDAGTAEGRDALHALIASADIVIEASRPRGLRQLGIDAEALSRERPGLSWISITGHGRSEPEANWIAYGDDAGVAAGLSWLMRAAHGRPMIVGDAIADPLTGLHAALAAWASWCDGGGRLVSLAMVDVVRHGIAQTSVDDPAARARGWRQWLTANDLDAVPPRAPVVAAAAAALGADTAAMLPERAPC
jgi:hypothetical protein